MSYVGGMTQDEIATQLGVSRPGVQRLLALARQEGLVKVHIDHPISTCMALGSALRERFQLAYCDVVPADTQAPESGAYYLAVAGAADALAGDRAFGTCGSGSAKPLGAAAASVCLAGGQRGTGWLRQPLRRRDGAGG